MSRVYTKGPRCGVDNCKSRHYQVINGQRVCRYGHVQEGDMEVGSDDDDFQSQGRRLNIPKDSQQSVIDHNNAVYYGNLGNALFMQCFQILVRKQVEWLIQHQGVPPQLEQVVKQLFGLYINDTVFASTKYSSRNDDPQEIVQATTTSGSSDSESEDSEHRKQQLEGENEDDSPDKDSSSTYKPVVVTEERVSLLHSVLIVYLGCVLLRIPIYIYDLNRWIYRYEMPFMNAMQFMPTEMKNKLAPNYISLLTPRSAPIDGSLHDQLYRLMKRFKTSNNLVFPTPMYQPLLFKTVHDLLLPPEIYIAVEMMMAKLDIKLEYAVDSRKRTMVSSSPEVQLVCMVVVAAKICFGLDANRTTRSSTEDDSPAIYPVDWTMWGDMLRKLWVEDESLSEADEKDVLYWDDAKIDRYLTWFEENFIHSKDEDESIVRKRLLDLFPMGVYDSQGHVTRLNQPQPPQGQQPPTQQNRRRSRRDSISVSPLPGTVTEILKSVHKTTYEYIPEGGEPLPGSNYPSYKSMSAAPQLMNTLYQSAGRLCAVRVNVIQQTCQNLEAALAKCV